MRVLDVGTGAGILAQAAVLLSAGCVWACDIDPEAVRVARTSAGPNLFIGSVDAVRSATAGLIVANISPETVARLAPELLRCLGTSGVALVSGFERNEAAALEAGFEQLGGEFCEFRYKAAWALLGVRNKLAGGV
jgi:ribosomal protein L11 methyltransferase